MSKTNNFIVTVVNTIVNNDVNLETLFYFFTCWATAAFWILLFTHWLFLLTELLIAATVLRANICWDRSFIALKAKLLDHSLCFGRFNDSITYVNWIFG